MVRIVYSVISFRQRADEIRPASTSHQQFPTCRFAGLETKRRVRTNLQIQFSGIGVFQILECLKRTQTYSIRSDIHKRFGAAGTSQKNLIQVESDSSLQILW